MCPVGKFLKSLLVGQNYPYHTFGNFWKNNYVECGISGDRKENLSVKEYFNEIKPYLRDIIINLQKSDTWKIQLKITINFISSKDADEDRVMHSKSNNIEFMIVCFYHVTQEFESESTLYSCLNVKELLAQSRRHI